MQKNFLLIFFTLLSFESAAQIASSDTIPLNPQLRTLFSRPVATSGLYFHNNTFYFASERCNKIYTYNVIAARVDSFPISGIHQDDEVEGITIFKNKIFIVTERDSHSTVFACPLSPGRGIGNFVRVEANNLPDAQRDPTPESGDLKGIEGIAGNEADGLIYLAAEQHQAGDGSYTYIYTYSYNENNGSLDYKRRTRIDLTEQEHSDWRISEIYFRYDNATPELFYLKTRKGSYGIGSIPVGTHGILAQGPYSTTTVFERNSITTRSNYFYNLNYSSNLEGMIAAGANQFFVISDNLNGRSETENCEFQVGSRAVLFMKVVTVR